MQNKEMIQKLFKGRALPRPPFIPLLGTYLTVVDQVSVKELLTDAGTLSSAITKTQQLLGYDGLTLPVDSTLEAEAFGAKVEWRDKEMPTILEHLPHSQEIDYGDFMEQGRVPVVLDTIRRLVPVYGKEQAIIAVVTGPLTILQNIYGEEIFEQTLDVIKSRLEVVCQALTQLCKSFGDEKVAGIIVNEEVEQSSLLNKKINNCYKTIFNVIKFYNLFGVLRISSDIETLEGQEHLPNVILGSDSSVFTSPSIKTKGVLFHTSFWEEQFDREEWNTKWNKQKKRRMFLSTGEPLQQSLDLTEVKEKVSVLCDESSWN